MELLYQWIEIFAFVTGIIYVVLEIFQKNLMWVVGIATGAACAISFGLQQTYSSMALNIYYVLVSFWGLYQWRMAKGKVSGEEKIHLEKLDKKVLFVSLLLLIIGSQILYEVDCRLAGGGSWQPKFILDSSATVLSAIATWWLAKSYLDQWSLWIFADILSTVLCIVLGMYWMSVLYLVYTLSAVYGRHYWKKHGEYV